MKPTSQHPTDSESVQTKRFWTSLNEYEQDEAFEARLDREFPEGTAELTEEEVDSSRRSFMKLMGAATSVAGLGLASCRRPEKYILPFTDHVEWVIPGKPLSYATAMPTSDGCAPMVATVHEGRPTNLQGNPLHPGSNGGCDSFATSSILDLYDPDRVRSVLKGGEEVTHADFDGYIGQLREQMATTKGEGVGLLMGELQSPSRNRLLGDLQKEFPKLKLFTHEPVSRSSRDRAAQAILGKGARELPRFNKATRVLSLDADFLGLEKPSSTSNGDFASQRKADEGKMNRLYVVENGYTLTGGMADHRLPIRTSEIVYVTAAIAKAVSKATGVGLPEELANLVKGEVSTHTVGDKNVLAEWVEKCVDDLVLEKGKALVVCGARQPVAVQALTIAINHALGSYGKTIDVVRSEVPPASGGLAQLAQDARDGKLSNLFVLGSNPAFTSASDIDWASISDAIGTVVALSDRVDDTAATADWVLPKAHYLESWGDVRSSDGTYSLIQPMILPLFGGISELDLLLVLSGSRTLAAPELEEGEEAREITDYGYQAVKATFDGLKGSVDFSTTLRDGFLPKSGFNKLNGGKPKLSKAAAEELIKEAGSYLATTNGMEIVFQPDSKVWDGRYINNSWRQELPDPITKLTWDNCAIMAPATFRSIQGLKASKYGFEEPQPMIKVSVGERELVLPVLEAPGHAANSITVTLGYGQEHGGRVGDGTGFNTYELQVTDHSYVEVGAEVEVAKDRYLLATTAEHYSMKRRALAREGTVEDLEKDKKLIDEARAKLDKEKTSALLKGEQKLEIWEWKQEADLAKAAKAFKAQGLDSHVPENTPLYRGQVGIKSEKNPEGFDYEKEHQWGMTIDLNNCIGCTACTIACQSENNIPVVGKDQVIQNREMHWIRMDRYFLTSDNVDHRPSEAEIANPEMITQPVACTQCESAPCETVCPVNATVHTEEGLNTMAYNRCIGTRYCANNCPYKARRFNFFDYNKRNPLTKKSLPGVGEFGNLYAGPLGDRKDKGEDAIQNLQKNPNVTVRMRGVMEKCTYCVQRLESAKIDQKIKAKGSNKTRIPTDSVKTACQQACPSNAITFGDLADTKSAVSKAKLSPRNYDLLNYVGMFPRTSYLARVKNPNKKMAHLLDYKEIGERTKFGH